MPLFRPSLDVVTTLHLDQTLPLPIQYDTFRQIITASPHLTHLSVYGDILLAWPGASQAIELPSLRSLRICGVNGMIYSDLLLGINAARLESLVLKDAQEFDLERFRASPNMFKFPQLKHLTFCDFEFSSHVYADLFRAFPAITEFTAYHPTTSATPMILFLLAQPIDEVDWVPWPDLETLTFMLNLSDDALIGNVIETRKEAGCPLTRLRLKSHLSIPRQKPWLWDVAVELVDGFEQWPTAIMYPDKDDDLFC